MPNIFSKPVSSDFQQTYVSQYVPLPLEQFARAQAKADYTQSQQEDYLQKASNATWDIHALEPDRQKLAELQSSFDSTADKLSNTDLTRRENQDLAKAAIQQISRDKDLATIMSNAAIAREYAKVKDEMIKAGTYQEYNDMFKNSYDNYVKNGGYKSGLGLDATIHKYSEERPKMEEYFNNMGENGADTLGKAGETYYKLGWEGISKDRITNKLGTGRAQEAFESYYQTPEGQQAARRFNYLKQTNPKYAKQFKGGAAEYVFKEFLDAGLERVHGKSTSGLAAAMNDERKRAQEEANLGTFSSTGQNTVLGGGFQFSDDDYDEQGNFTGSGKSLIDVFKNNINPDNTPINWFTNKDFNKASEKDQRKLLVHAAARLNGKTDKEYFEQHAGESVKLTTSFKTIPTKKADAYQKQFFNPATGTGVFDNATVISNGEQMKLTEFLRRKSEEGELTDSKGDKIKLSDKPTVSEVREALKKAGVGIKGQFNPNYQSPLSFNLGIGNQEVTWDRTNGMNEAQVKALIKSGELTPRQIAEYKFERIKTSPEIEGEGDDAVIHYFDDATGQILAEKLKNIK